MGASGSTCSNGTTYATGYGYNAAQELTGFNYGNGVAATFGYSNDRLKLTSLNYKKGASTLFGLSYSYGAAGSNNGQIRSITDSVDSGRNATYTYDTLARLSTAVTTGSANYPAWGLQESYDRYGNRWSQAAISGCTGIPCPQPSVVVSATTNRITGSPFAYDANGNMTNDGINTLVYDAENHAVSSSSGAYSYDGKGLRVKKCVPNCSSPTTTTVYLFSGSKVIAEYDNGAAPTAPSREYIYSGAALLAKIDSSGTKYYHQDHLSNRLVTNSTGTTSAQLGHFPFGESWYNASNDKLLFTSYERDAESGNDFAMARYHINRLGRFSSPAPLAGSVGDPQSLNRYAYVSNDPANLIDPLGMNVMFPWDWFGGSGVCVNLGYYDPDQDNRWVSTGGVWCIGGGGSSAQTDTTAGGGTPNPPAPKPSKSDGGTTPKCTTPGLVVNGNRAQTTPSGGLSLELDPVVAKFFSEEASINSGRSMTFQANSVLSVDLLSAGAYQTGFTPPLRVGLPGPDVTISSVTFGANGSVTGASAKYIKVVDMSGLVTRQLNAAFSEKGIPGTTVRTAVDFLNGKNNNLCIAISVTPSKK